MRLKSGIWVAAYVRRCDVEGVFAAVRRRGAEDAGAIFIKLNRLDGTGTLYGPAPQSVFETERPADRFFIAMVGGATPATDARSRRGLRVSSNSIPMSGSWKSKTGGAGTSSTKPSSLRAERSARAFAPARRRFRARAAT